MKKAEEVAKKIRNFGWGLFKVWLFLMFGVPFLVLCVIVLVAGISVLLG